ncbi:ovarian-specific serine/threonine-protein kinase Lok isoform X2 [Anabrus simplex]|uniref:ovarian-specific serine/threonine-protein kinase Lok isoform X2 n=1 Tax=Anabrus simplex TaxID=316456 RepID=UPI0035A3BE46
MEQKGCWGYLVPCSVESPPIELHKTEVLVGRESSCDVLLQGSLLGCKQENISKHHFYLVHDTQGTVLKDVSRTGTFVNGRPVGRGKQTPISHGARIDIIRIGVKAFVFLDRAVSDNGNQPKAVKDKYVMGSQLGEGGFGQVYLVLDKPCMIRAYEIFSNQGHLYLVLEYIAGGDLSRWVNNKKLLSEKQTKLLFYQLTLAVQYMHQNSITHRDLKPANILLVSSSPHTLIKVTDFGLAKDQNLHSDMTTCAGTEVYVAPEVMVSSPYTNKVDIWSMGVILYYSLSGTLPFNSLGEARRVQHHVMFAADKWRYVSLTALELVKRMLVTSPERRANVNEVLASPWLQDEPMKEDAHSLMGSHVVQSPASPTGEKLLSPTNRNTPQVARNNVSPTRPKAVSPAKVTAVSPARINVVLPARLNIPSPADKSPSPTPQNRTPVSPRGVLQYLTPSSGADKPKVANPPIHVAAVPAINQSPNRLRARSPASPKKWDYSPAPVSPYKPGQFAVAVGVKLPVVHKAQKTFLLEARKNLKSTPGKP